MSTTFTTGNTFYPKLISTARDSKLMNSWIRVSGEDESAFLTLNLDSEMGRTFLSTFADEVANFTEVPHTKLKIEAYWSRVQALKGGPSSSSSEGGAVKKIQTVSKATLATWMKGGEDGRINPELLKYIRESADHFEGVELKVTDYTTVRSASLSHRKMMSYLIDIAGSVDAAVRWVDEKILHEDPVATAAIIAIPRSKIELILSEYSMINREGAFSDFLNEVFDRGCVFSHALVDYVPEFIGGGSKAELASGRTIDPETRRNRRIAFARSNCNYLRSLFTSQFFVRTIRSGRGKE